MSTQQTTTDDQTTLDYWSTVAQASILKPCPVCGAPVAKRRIHAHITSDECEPAAQARSESEFREVRAR